jgi:pyruvate/2-oxoglutarate dehydrogenase complex dihydrolipoamide dehydrogenase (E3) component
MPNDAHPETTANFPAFMSRMRRVRAQISASDSARRFTGLGVDVFFGSARFISPQSVDIDGQTLCFKRCIIATGARPMMPDVPGLLEVGCLTNESIFSLTELPPRLAVIGGGPIGCEMAQAFARFGSRVTLIQRGPQLLPRDEPEAAQIVAEQLRREDVEVICSATPSRAEKIAAGKRLTLTTVGGVESVEADAILIAAGRAPNVGGFGLDSAGIQFTDRGITANDYLQTTNPRIFAAGDVVGSYQFTHAADAMARICIQNAFFSLGPFGRRRLSELVVPWTTYTDPEVAHIGLTQAAAEQQGIPIDTYREDLQHVDRAVLDGETRGFAVLHCRRGTAQVVGCTIVGRHAGEMIGEVALLMTARLNLSTLSRTIHCYPTQIEVLKRLADQYNRRRLTPRVAAILKAIIEWTR